MSLAYLPRGSRVGAIALPSESVVKRCVDAVLVNARRLFRFCNISHTQQRVPAHRSWWVLLARRSRCPRSAAIASAFVEFPSVVSRLLYVIRLRHDLGSPRPALLLTAHSELFVCASGSVRPFVLEIVSSRCCSRRCAEFVQPFEQSQGCLTSSHGPACLMCGSSSRVDHLCETVE